MTFKHSIRNLSERCETERSNSCRSRKVMNGSGWEIVILFRFKCLRKGIHGWEEKDRMNLRNGQDKEEKDLNTIVSWRAKTNPYSDKVSENSNIGWGSQNQKISPNNKWEHVWRIKNRLRFTYDKIITGWYGPMGLLTEHQWRAAWSMVEIDGAACFIACGLW